MNKGNDVYINFEEFKAKPEPKDYDEITRTIVDAMCEALKENSLFVVHFDMKTLTLSDLEHYMKYSQNLAKILQTLFPNKLQTCYVYNAPSFIKASYHAFFKLFMDSVTRKKIILVE